jgi:hypothetical protein
MPPMLEGDMQGAMLKLHSQDKPVTPKAETKKPEAKKAEPAPPPKPEAKQEGGLKGFFKSLTGSKK